MSRIKIRYLNAQIMVCKNNAFSVNAATMLGLKYTLANRRISHIASWLTLIRSLKRGCPTGFTVEITSSIYQ